MMVEHMLSICDALVVSSKSPKWITRRIKTFSIDRHRFIKQGKGVTWGILSSDLIGLDCGSAEQWKKQKQKKCVFVAGVGWVVEQKTPRPSKWSRLHPDGRGNKKGLWTSTCHDPICKIILESSWGLGQPTDWGRDLSSELFCLLLLYTLQKLFLRPQWWPEWSGSWWLLQASAVLLVFLEVELRDYKGLFRCVGEAHRTVSL